MILRIITAIAYWTLDEEDFRRRCLRFSAGYGFRYLGIDWCRPDEDQL
jgi:hypothetical protein